MVKNDDLKTSPRQRIVIVVVALLMLFSTCALYVGIVLNYGSTGSTNNNLTSEEQARYDELLSEYNDKVQKQTKELSDKYFETFKQYKGNVKSFNAASVDNIQTEDLKIGNGETVSDKDFSNYSAYYIGWLSDETVFDSSFDDFDNPTSLKSPLSGATSLIEGWGLGIVGMRIGGVRLVTIPSALAYGEQGQGDAIPANSPLKFIIMLIDPVEEVAASDELMNLYYKASGINVSTSSDEENDDSTEGSSDAESSGE